jgi:uncharacterized protein HemX
MLLAMQTKIVEEAASSAISTITGTVLGALLVLTTAVAIWAVWALNKAQNDMQKAKDAMADKMQDAHQASTALSLDLMKQFNANASELESLTMAVESSTNSLKDLTYKIERVDRAIEFLSRGSGRHLSVSHPPQSSSPPHKPPIRREE